jgi:hypothetical protein
MLTPNDYDLGIIEYFYYNFKIKQYSMSSIFNNCEDDYYNNYKLFLHVFSEIPKTFNEYTNKIQDLKTINKKENHTLIVFEVLDLFLKIYDCNPSDYHDLFLGLNKLQKNTHKSRKNDDNEDIDSEDIDSEDDDNENECEDDEEQIVYKFKYKLLKNLFSMFEHYFIFYMYVSNKDEYLTKLSTSITSNIHINTQFKLFIKNMNKFLDLFMDEINTDVRNNMFHYISNLKEKYESLPKPTQ